MARKNAISPLALWLHLLDWPPSMISSRTPIALSPSIEPAPTPMTDTSTQKTLLVVVASDPRASHRPAEAIRLAAGVAAWRKVAVTLFFTGPAIAAVSADCDDFVDEQSYTRYLPMFLESGGAIYLDSNAVAPT